VGRQNQLSYLLAHKSSNFLRTDSDVIAKIRGTFQERPKHVLTEVKKKKKKETVSGIRALGAGGSGGSASDVPANQVKTHLSLISTITIRY